jgi:polysaccharide pyruvyl transferase WcaK-like protein
MSNIFLIAQAADLDAQFFFPYNIDWRPHGKRLKLILKRFDVILVNGEGSIHNPSENKRAESLLELPLLAKEIGLPIYLINATIHKMSDDAYLAIKNFKAIYVRDSESKKILENKNIKSTVIPDFSFFSEPLAKPEEISKRNRILVTGSTIRKTHKDLALLSRRSHSDFKDIFFIGIGKFLNY